MPVLTMPVPRLSRPSGLAKLVAFVLTGALTTSLTACSSQAPEMEAPPPPPVSVLTVAPATLEKTEELTGRVAALRTAEIRPQVNGIVQKRLFEQGAEVRAGQPLFQINAAPFKADAERADAALKRAEAVLARARIQAERLAPLVQTEAISRQTYDDAVSQRDQAAADVAQARSDLARRRLDVGFATVDAPITGRIEQAQISEGALVGPTDTTPMTRIQQIDQVYVDVRQPASSLPALRTALGDGSTPVAVTILRDDGEPYGMKGRILFSGLSIDERSGNALVRVLVDNPERQLLPGMFVRARLALARFPDALSVPQQALSRTGGETKVWVLGDDNTVRAVTVQPADLIGRDYRIPAGLKVGDKVVVEGLDRMHEGAVVAPRDWQAPGVPTRTAAAAH